MEDRKKVVIFISHPRKDDSLSQKWSEFVFNKVILPTVTQIGYQKPVRLDGFKEKRFISGDVINQLIASDLVIADLTGLNPEVFYQIAICHVTQKPLIYVIKEGEIIPHYLVKESILPISSNSKKTKSFISLMKKQIKDSYKKNNIGLKGGFTMSGSLFDILTEISSSIKTIEVQIANLDNKITSIKGDVQLIQTNTTPFVERRLAKLEAVRYKVHQKKLPKINTKTTKNLS